MRCASILLALVFVMVATSAGAVEPGEILDDPMLEARARSISKELRCLVCQNQSIDDSDASLARDLRVLVRERLVAGDSDDKVIACVTARYGDFVLLRPPFKPTTYGLWLGPAAIFLFGVIGVFVFLRRRSGTLDNTAGVPPLSEEESGRVARLLGGDSKQ